MESTPKILQAVETGFFRTLQMIKKSYNSPLEHSQYLQNKYGDAVMLKVGRFNYVHLFGAEANRLVLLNKDQVFSNKKAWDLIIGRIFPNGLMLRDADDHRYHRRIMQAGFKTKPMRSYMEKMADHVPRAMQMWLKGGNKTLLAYPTFKKLTLDLAATIFLGLDFGSDAKKINRAFEIAVAASMPKIPFAFPGTLLWRGIRARKTMRDYFLALVASKQSGSDSDMFSLLCRAKDEDGNQYTDDEIVDHMIFLMMAAHDTTTSTLTSMCYALAKNPQWQERLYDEIKSLGVETLTYERLEKMTETDWVIKEALRLYPPLSTLPKFSNSAFEYAGFTIPEGAIVVTYPIHTHYMSQYWSEPTRFDPERFSEQRAEQKQHPYCWLPFSGGAHMCIGLHFANMQIKLIIFEMLKRFRWSVPDNYIMPVQQSPISKPRDGLPISIELR